MKPKYQDQRLFSFSKFVRQEGLFTNKVGHTYLLSSSTESLEKIFAYFCLLAYVNVRIWAIVVWTFSAEKKLTYWHLRQIEHLQKVTCATCVLKVDFHNYKRRKKPKQTLQEKYKYLRCQQTLSGSILWENGQDPSKFLHRPRRNLQNISAMVNYLMWSSLGVFPSQRQLNQPISILTLCKPQL